MPHSQAGKSSGHRALWGTSVRDVHGSLRGCVSSVCIHRFCPDDSSTVCELVNGAENSQFPTLSSRHEMAHTSTYAGLMPAPQGPGRAPLAVGKAEAAQLLGVSEDYLDEHIRPEVRVVRVGRRVLFPMKELERWLELHSSLALDR